MQPVFLSCIYLYIIHYEGEVIVKLELKAPTRVVLFLAVKCNARPSPFSSELLF